MKESSYIQIETKLDKDRLEILQKQLNKEKLQIPTEVQIENSDQVTSFLSQRLSSIQQMKKAIAECTSALAEFSTISQISSDGMKKNFQDTTATVEKLRDSFTTVMDSFSSMKQMSLPTPDSSGIEKLTLPYKNAGDLLSNLGKQIIGLPALD